MGLFVIEFDFIEDFKFSFGENFYVVGIVFVCLLYCLNLFSFSINLEYEVVLDVCFLEVRI